MLTLLDRAKFHPLVEQNRDHFYWPERVFLLNRQPPKHISRHIHQHQLF